MQNVSKIPFYRNPKVRGVFYQILLFSILLWVGYFLINNTLHNMETRNIKTGFDFLGSEAGFGIVQSLIEYSEKSTFARTFLVGLLNTILVSLLSISFATILGFIMGVARLSENWIVAELSKWYIEIFRNIPLLIQILFWYAIAVALPSVRSSISFGDAFFLNNRGFYLPKLVFQEGTYIFIFSILLSICLIVFFKKWSTKYQDDTGKQIPVFGLSLLILIFVPTCAAFILEKPFSLEYPKLTGFNFTGGISIIPELIALLVALTIYTGTFIAEIVRSGILAVSHGQTEAAYASGLTRGQTIRLIILPQALRVIIPPLATQYLAITKNSALGTAIGYPDLFSVFAGTTLNQTGQAVEIIFITMSVYLFLSLLISLFMNWYNHKINLIER